MSRLLYIGKKKKLEEILIIDNLGAIPVYSYSSYEIANGQLFVLTGSVIEVIIKFNPPTGSPNFNIRAKIYDGSVANDSYSLPASTLLGISTNVIPAINANGYVTFYFDNIYCDGTINSIVFTFENVVTHNAMNRINTLISISNPYPAGARLSCAATATWFSSSSYALHMSIKYIQ